MKKQFFVKVSVVGFMAVLTLPVANTMMKSYPNNPSFAFAFAATANTPGTAQIYFEENFRNYRVHAPTTADDPGIAVFNDPIFAKLAGITVDIQKSGLVLKEYSAPSKDVTSYDVQFKFRLQGDEPRHFDVYLRQNNKGQSGNIIIGISSQEITFSGSGVSSAVKGAVKLPFELKKNAYHDAIIKVNGSDLKLYLNGSTDGSRVFQEVASTKIPQLPSAGINFYGYAGAPFRLTNIVLQDSVPIPDNSLLTLLPAPREIDTSGFKRGATETVNANDSFGATIITGKGVNDVKMTVNWSEGAPTILTFSSKLQTDKIGQRVSEIPDSIISLTGFKDKKQNVDVYVRPLMRRYRSNSSVTDTYEGILREFNKLPAASEYPLKIELRKTPIGVDLYLGGSLASSINGSSLKDLTFTASTDAAIGNFYSRRRDFNVEKFVPVDIASQHMAKSFANATATIEPGLNKIQGIPLMVTSGNESADVGLTRAGQGNWALEVDEYTARSPFDGLLTEIHARRTRY